MITRSKRLLEERTADDTALVESSQAGEAPEVGPPPAKAAQAAATADPVRLFNELLQRLPSQEELAEARREVDGLRQAGYSAADIEFAVRWTARNIPSARRFAMVALSIQEALEEKWSI
jgi:hypothetical protein